MALGWAMLKQPSLILADEPTGALDAENEAQVLIFCELVNAGPVPLLLRTAMRWRTSATGVLICLGSRDKRKRLFFAMCRLAMESRTPSPGGTFYRVYFYLLKRTVIR